MIFIKACEILDFGNEIFGITLNQPPLSEETLKLIQNIFPHTQEEVHKLLDKEALLEAIIPEPSQIGTQLENRNYTCVEKSKSVKK